MDPGMAEAAKEEEEAESTLFALGIIPNAIKTLWWCGFNCDDVYETVEKQSRSVTLMRIALSISWDEANKAAETLPVERSGNKFGRVTPRSL